MNRKPPPKDEGSGEAEESATKKRKRRSPAVPWKKPKDMPKRPLSAYNIFFKEERERLASTVGESDAQEQDSESAANLGAEASPTRKQKKPSAYVQKIAARWKSLDKKARAPFEQRAAKEKEKYDKEVAVWREQQKEKKSAEALRQSQEGASMAHFAARGESFQPMMLHPLHTDPFQLQWHPHASAQSRMEANVPVVSSLLQQPQILHPTPQYLSGPPTNASITGGPGADFPQLASDISSPARAPYAAAASSPGDPFFHNLQNVQNEVAESRQRLMSSHLQQEGASYTHPFEDDSRLQQAMREPPETPSSARAKSTSPGEKSSLQHLSNELDSESIDFIVKTFKSSPEDDAADRKDK